jgi:hypothetical protein
MTNEEIKEHAETILLLLTDSYTDDERRRTENILRFIATQRYEEAAHLASGCYLDGHDAAIGKHIASRIRTLKASLQPDVPS